MVRGGSPHPPRLQPSEAAIEKEFRVSDYDVAVIGGGPGGYVAALRAAQRGAKTCLVEKHLLGGCCLNVGCIPTKAMLHASEVFRHIGRASEYGFEAGEAKVDGAAFMARMEKVVKPLRDGVGMLLKARKVDVLRGRGRLSAADTVVVETDDGEETVKASSVIVATGSRPARPGFIPWDSGRVMTTDEATTADGLYDSILIVGGGVIGCEFATVYSELGFKTTVVEMLDRLVSVIDPDAAKAIHASLKKRKADVRTGAKIVEMGADEDGVVAKLEGGDEIEADAALIAVGRTPNVEDMGLEGLGVEFADGVIRVDERCHTNVDGVYAVGDCGERLQYAHLASRMGAVAADNATGHDTTDDRAVVPVGVYTHPEIATVGLSEEEAREERGDDGIRVAQFPYQASGMARAYGDTEGGVKLIADSEMGEILGAVVIGQHATDVVQEVACAMRNELTVEELANTIHPHPTFVEAVGEAAEAWMGLPVHMKG
jgi:dihydrolipoamide dehydrogenase